jgi:hypothetical protein
VVTDMPIGLKGIVKYNKDGSYTIVINARYTFEQQTEFYLHELHHILNGDFDINNCIADELEIVAHAQ